MKYAPRNLPNLLPFEYTDPSGLEGRMIPPGGLAFVSGDAGEGIPQTLFPKIRNLEVT